MQQEELDTKQHQVASQCMVVSAGPCYSGRGNRDQSHAHFCRAVHSDVSVFCSKHAHHAETSQCSQPLSASMTFKLCTHTSLRFWGFVTTPLPATPMLNVSKCTNKQPFEFLSLSHTHTLSLSLSPTHTLSLKHTLSLTLTHTHTHTCTHTHTSLSDTLLSLSLSLTQTLSLS